jgi:hypothetical protein
MTNRGKSLVQKLLVIQWELDQDVQSIYHELKKYAKSCTAAKISGDAMFQYISTAQLPMNWRETSYAFVLHWKDRLHSIRVLSWNTFHPSKSSGCYLTQSVKYELLM